MLKQIFRTDRKFWTSKNSEQIEVFFQFNQFFSTFYQHQDFQKIVAMTFYAKINKGSEIFLQFNKRPEAVILLSGQIQIFKKIYLDLSPKKKKKNSNKKIEDQTNYESLGIFNKENQTILLGSQCKIQSFNNSQAQILFIPSLLYNAHEQKLKQQKVNSIFVILKKYFNSVHKTSLFDLAGKGCYFKQYRMYDYIYRAGDTPQFVYLLLQGNVKLQKPGFSAKKMFDMIVISPQILFGQSDILFQNRQKSAMSCSAFIRTLVIPKIPFIKFAQQYLPNLQLNKKVQTQKLPQLKKSIQIVSNKKYIDFIQTVNWIHKILSKKNQQEIVIYQQIFHQKDQKLQECKDKIAQIRQGITVKINSFKSKGFLKSQDRMRNLSTFLIGQYENNILQTQNFLEEK